MVNIQIKEEEQKQAFEYYWILGLSGKLSKNQRVEKVAERFDRNRRTVYKWKEVNQWDLMEEIKNDMVEVARENLSPETVAILQGDLLLIINQIVAEYLSYVQGEDGNPLKIRNPLDLKRVIEALNAMTGGPPKKETKEVTHQGVIAVIHGDKDLLDDLMEIENGKVEPVSIDTGAERVEGSGMEDSDGGGSGSQETDTGPSSS